jgi:DNA-binding Lrp family transcriptional regulator
MSPDRQEESLIRLLQTGLPLISDPWTELGRQCGYSGTEVLDKLRRWREEGLIRRFGAFLDHYKTGLSANAMVVWVCPEDRIEDVGSAIAALRSVTHCYERMVSQKWPYNLYTMIHGDSYESLEAIIAGIARDNGLSDYRVLYSKKEYKKTASRLFMEDHQ